MCHKDLWFESRLKQKNFAQPYRKIVRISPGLYTPPGLYIQQNGLIHPHMRSIGCISPGLYVPQTCGATKLFSTMIWNFKYHNFLLFIVYGQKLCDEKLLRIVKCVARAYTPPGLIRTILRYFALLIGENAGNRLRALSNCENASLTLIQRKDTYLSK